MKRPLAKTLQQKKKLLEATGHRVSTQGGKLKTQPEPPKDKKRDK